MKDARGLQNTKKNLVPLQADINIKEEELILCTRNDLRFVDLNTGRLKRIHTHLISPDEQDMLTSF